MIDVRITVEKDGNGTHRITVSDGADPHEPPDVVVRHVTDPNDEVRRLVDGIDWNDK